MKRHVYAVLGRPGTEAAMVARLLGARLNAEVVSVPSAATAEVEHSTHLGKRLQDAANSAGPTPLPLLPSSLVAPLVMPRLERYATQTSGAARPVPLILSNFPRTNDQLTMLQRCALPVEPTILHLMMSREDAEARLAARRVCATCGEPMYPLEAATGASPPPGGGGTLHAHLVEDASDCDAPRPARSSLDEPEAARARLDAYDSHTTALVERLRARGSSVLEVPASTTDFGATWREVEAACGLEPIEL